MPRYNYICEGCTVSDYQSSAIDGLSIFIDRDTKNYSKEPFVWEVIHGMKEDPEIRCPLCDVKCERTMMGVRTAFIMLGDFLKNTTECKILSNIHRLQNDDPYAGMRQSGEVDDKVGQFKKALKRNYKKDRPSKKAASTKKKFDLGKKTTTIQ